MQLQQELSPAVMLRVEAWKIALADACTYFAIARSYDQSSNDGPRIWSAAGGTLLSHAIPKGMISAAIISACQIVTSGDEGPDVANNNSTALKELRNALFLEADARNDWSAGTTERLLCTLKKQHRHKLLAHYDGKSANTTLEGGALRWTGPNPWYRANAFAEVEVATETLYRITMELLGQQPRHQDTSAKD